MRALEEFRKSPLAKQWLDVVDSKTFQRATEVVMLTMSENLSAPSGDAQACAANNLRLQGAQMFLRQLVKAAEQEAPREKPKQNLDHTK